MSAILIIDFMKENLGITTEILKPKYEVFAADNLQIALKIVNDNNPDIVLINQVIPRASGVDVLKLLPRDKKDFLAIMMTGVKDIEIVVDSILSGFDGFIRIPVEMERFEEQLSSAKKIHQIRKEADDYLKVKATKAMSITFAHYTRNLLTPLVGYLDSIKTFLPENIFNIFDNRLNKINKLTYKIEELLKNGELKEFCYTDNTEFYDIKLDDDK